MIRTFKCFLKRFLMHAKCNMQNTVVYICVLAELICSLQFIIINVLQLQLNYVFLLFFSTTMLIF